MSKNIGPLRPLRVRRHTWLQYRRYKRWSTIKHGTKVPSAKEQGSPVVTLFFCTAYSKLDLKVDNHDLKPIVTCESILDLTTLMKYSQSSIYIKSNKLHDLL